jgi:hypothetical protein
LDFYGENVGYQTLNHIIETGRPFGTPIQSLREAKIPFQIKSAEIIGWSQPTTEVSV